MAKNAKNKSKKVRSFKVHTDAYGIPFVRFGGKYLPKELGINCGDRLEMTRDNDKIILRKFSAQEVNEYETAKKVKAAQALLNKLLPDRSRPKQTSTIPTMMVAENRTNAYTVDEEISKHSEKYSQAKNG